MYNFLEIIASDNYFILFLSIMVMILIVLVIALVKTRRDFYESKENLEDDLLKNIMYNTNNERSQVIKTINNTNNDEKIINNINKEEKTIKDVIDKPLPVIEDYYSIIDKYENSEEESAVISTDELLKRTEELHSEMGVSDNQAMIEKYEEEQENKAIISYEQLLKNASKITLTYSDEKNEEGCPLVKKVEVKNIDVGEARSYIEEEKFLEILKNFRTSLEG